MSISAATEQARQAEAVIVVPMLPPRECSPNWHGHWRVARRSAREFRQCAGWAVMAVAHEQGSDLVFGSPVVMDVEVAWCCGRKRMDDDNCWASLKAMRDGIADVLFEGKDHRITQGTLTQTRGDGTVTVTLRSAS